MKNPDELRKGLGDLQRKLESVEQLESTYSQVSKALCGKENASLDELLQAVSQAKDRLAQVERERDAALNAIHAVCSFCEQSDFPKECERCLLTDYSPEKAREDTNGEDVL